MVYLYAAIAMVIAVVGGLTDIRYGRVKNKHLLYALAGYVCVLLVDVIAHRGISFDVVSILLNALFSVAVTLFLYMKDIWAPGDGKLFLLISLVYPIALSPCFSGNVFPALDIVIYAFAVGYMALLVSTLARKKGIHSKVLTIDVLKRIQWTRVFNIISNIGLISIIDTGLQFAFPDFLVTNRSLCTLCVVGCIYFANTKVSLIRKCFGCVGLCAFFFVTLKYKLWSSMALTCMQSFAISVIVEILNERIDKNSYRTITGSEVKPGMILSHATIWDMQKCVDTALPRSTTETRRSRLTIVQAQAVQLWCKNAKRSVTIVEMLPFAPCIAIATIIHFVRFVIAYR